MNSHTIHASLTGRLLILGFGSIGRAALPILLRHIEIERSSVSIISAEEDAEGIAAELGVNFLVKTIDVNDYEVVLDEYLQPNDFLLNLSVNISSMALIRYCWERNILYLDTCIEPWPGRYTDPETPVAKRTNYKLREELLAFRLDKRSGATAVVTQGANPGMASIFVKQAIMNMALDNGIETKKPACYEDWASLAQKLNIKVIHISERDTQISSQRKKRDEFVNTWSVHGFISEALQPSEIGWGTHEKKLPLGGARHGYGSDAAIYLNQPGAGTRIRSWTPLEGSYHGFLITHGESISIADHLTLREEGNVIYRPTVNYAYHPCDDALLSLHELAGKNWQQQSKSRIMYEDIVEGMDELGVLLLGNPKGAYWLGSRLAIEQARSIAPHNTATSLQVVAGILGGMVWALQNPRCGAVEPDDIDYELVMKIAAPYLGDLVGVYGEWSPVKDRRKLFDEEIDEEDIWQFKNFLV